MHVDQVSYGIEKASVHSLDDCLMPFSHGGLFFRHCFLAIVFWFASLWGIGCEVGLVGTIHKAAYCFRNAKCKLRMWIDECNP